MPFLNNTPHVPGPPRPIATKVSDEHGVKRKFEEMAGLVPPTKRVFDGSFRVAPSINLPENALTETLFVPDHMVGLLIGAGGQHVMTLQNETSTKIEVAPNSYGKPRAVTLTGLQENINEVRTRIQGLIDQHGGDAQNSDVETIDIVIPAAKAGLIIGSGGATIKQLMGESNAKMYLIQETNQNNGIDKPLKITGSKEAVQKARTLVLDLINQGSGGAPPYIEIPVPKAAVGLIIGNGGNTIKKMQEDFNVRIQFKPDIPTQDPTTKICQILGEPDDYQNCAQKILEMVSSMEQRKGGEGGFHGNDNDHMAQQYSAPIDNSQTVVQMSVPASKAGLVIGKNGEVIRLLKMQSGANIELDRHAKANANSDKIRIFKISGSQYQAAKAQHLIKQIVGEVPKHQRFMTQQEFMQQGGQQGGGGQPMMNQQMMQPNQMPFMGGMMGGPGGSMDPMQQMGGMSGGFPGAGGGMMPNAGNPAAGGWMNQAAGGMPGGNMMMPGAQGGSGGNPYEQWTQWMQSFQKQAAGQPDYMNQYMEYMKKYMEQMGQQSGQNYSKEQIDMWMNYMKSMLGGGAGGATGGPSGGVKAEPGTSGVPGGMPGSWPMPNPGAAGGSAGGSGGQNQMEAMEQWQRFYQQMQQQ